MAPRAYWKGHIRLSLVSFPVRLHAAVTQSEKISLHQYDRETGERIHYKKVGDSGEEVLPGDIVKGYEYEKGSYVPISEEDLEKLKLESKHTIELVQFTDIKDIDPIYFDKSYYIVPEGGIAEEAFLTVREALKSSRKAAIGQVVLSSKERIVAIRPCSKGLIMDTLRYAYEVREREQYFAEIPEKADIDKEQLELAELLIERKTKPFDPKAFKDHYNEGLKEIIDAKLEGEEIEVATKGPKRENVVNIVEALKRSLEQSGGSSAEETQKTKTRKSGRKSKSSKSKEAA